MKTLLTPGVCLLAVAALVHTGLIAPGAAVISYAFYGAWIAGLLLAWRFHSTRIFSALLVLFLAQQALSYFSSAQVPPSAQGNTALAAIGLILPLDFVLLSFEREKGFTFSSLAPVGLLLFVESVIVAVLCRPDPLAAAARAFSSATGFRNPTRIRGRGDRLAYTLLSLSQTRGKRFALGTRGIFYGAAFWRRGTNSLSLF